MGIRRGPRCRSEENPILLAAILYDLQQPFANFHYHLMSISQFSTKVSFFLQCSKMQLITFQNFHIQTCFSQFL